VRHLLLIAAGLAFWYLFASTLLPKLKEAANQPKLPTTQNAMKQVGLVFKLYASESAGNCWPTLAHNERIWAPDLSVIYPEYLTDPSVLVAREHPDADDINASLRAVLDGPNPDCETAEGLMALSFAYLGHATNTEVGLQALLEARKAGLVDGSDEPRSIPGRTEMLLPLRGGIERFLITDINGPFPTSRFRSSVPVLIETWQWKTKLPDDEFKGCNVLYFDGHVDWVPLGTFPVVPSVMDGLCGFVP
jgi:prepilin-type processing-associated H-X9-DG protein